VILAGPFPSHAAGTEAGRDQISASHPLATFRASTSQQAMYSLSARQAWLPSTPPVSGWFPGRTVQTRRPTTCAAPHRLSVSVGERKRNGPSPWVGWERTEGPTIETAIDAASGTMVEAVLTEAVLAGAVLGATTGVGGSGGARHLSVTASESATASSGAVRRIARDLAPRLRMHSWQDPW
jgi:hypothetical protein